MKKRVFNILLCVVMVVGLMPITFASGTQTTSTDTATKKTVMLGSNSPLGYDSTTEKYDKLYFGTYYASEDDATGTPYEWRILDGKTNVDTDGLFLLSMPVYDNIRFTLPIKETDSFWTQPHNYWTSSGCSAREWCKSLAASTKVFLTAERNAMLETNKEWSRYRTVDDWYYKYYGSLRVSELVNDRVFFLSAQEFENADYGLDCDTDYASTTYMLRDAADGFSYTVDDKTIYDGAISSVWKRSSWSELSTNRIYYKEFSGHEFNHELTAAEKFFIGSAGDFGFFGNFLPTGANEAYSYEYIAHTARPAMNLDGNKVLYITAADNSGHNIAYGSDISTTNTCEWKTVLLNDDTSFKDGVTLTNAPENLVFDTEGGTMNVNYTLGEGYDAVTASLTDKDGNIIYYGTINDSVTIPANLTDGVYTLRITAEDRNDEKVSDLASQPYVAQIKVANAHNHAVCGKSGCTDEGHTAIDWTPITTTKELAEMTSDSHCFLIGDVEAPEAEIKGHLCVNGFAVTGTLKAGDNFTLCNCHDSVDVPKVTVADGYTFNQYSLHVDSMTLGNNSTLNLAGIGKNSNVGYCGVAIESLGTGVKLNVGKYSYLSSIAEQVDYDFYFGLRLTSDSTVNIYDGGKGGVLSTLDDAENVSVTVHEGGSLSKFRLCSSTATLTVADGGSVGYVEYAASGSVVNLYKCAATSISSDGTVNLYGAVSGATFYVDKPINICADLGDAPKNKSTIDIKDKSGKLKLTDGVFTEDWSTKMGEKADNFSQYFQSASGYTVGKDENGELRCEKIGHVAGSHPICGEECSDGQDHQGVQWTEIGVWSDFDNDDWVTLTGGNYCLTADVKAGDYEQFTINGDVTICLNGNTMNLNYGHIVVKSGSLTICDCVGTGKITGGGGKSLGYSSMSGEMCEKYKNETNTPNINSFGGAIYMNKGVTLNLYGGNITGNTAHFGGAVYVPSNSSFNMYGGSLSGNTGGGAATSIPVSSYAEHKFGEPFAKGGAVYINGGTFNLKGGTISGNKTVTWNQTKATGLGDGGGAVYMSSGAFNMSGGTVTGNSAGRYTSYLEIYKNVSWDFAGCGIRMTGGTFTVTGGSFDAQNDAVTVNGGIFNFNGGSFKNSGRCSYCYNEDGTRGEYRARGRSSQIWVSGGNVNMTGGNIVNSDEPVTILGGAFNMSGGSIAKCSYPVQIKGGTFDMSGGRIGSDEYKSTTGVALTAGTFNMSGGEISNLKKGVDVASGTTFKVSGAPMITGNYDTKNYGGKISQNVCLASGAQMTVGTLTTGANIGVKMENGTGVFSSGGSTYSGYFLADNSDDYEVTVSGSDLQLSTTATAVTLNGILADNEALKTDDDGNYILNMKVGDSVKLSASIEPSGSSYEWYLISDRTEWITIDEDGTLTAVGAVVNGTSLNLVYKNGNAYKTINVYVTEPEYYTVTYDMQDHGTQIDSSEVTPNNAMSAPEAPTADGYVFGGWYKDEECTEAWNFAKNTDEEGYTADKVTTNVTLYAKWTPSQYILTLDPDGGICSEKTIQPTFGKAYGELPTPTRTAYEFAGWFDNSGKEITAETVLDTVPAETKAGRTLTAHWTALPATAPTVTAGDNVTLTYGYQESKNISVSATAADVATTISGYQWYTCDDTSKTNPKVISGATNSSYDIEKGKAAGTYYYYCEVTAKRNDNNTTATAKSNVISVTVDKAQLNAAVTMANYAYGAQVPTPSVSGNTENGAVTYYYNTSNSNSGGTKWESITPTTLNVGTYYIYAQIAETSNYATFTTPAIEFKVTKTDPTVSAWPTISGTVYVNDAELTDDRLNGGTSAVNGTFSITGVKSWSESGSQTTEVTFTPSDKNYNTIKQDINVTVSKRTVQSITTTIPAITDRNYNTAIGDLGLPATVSIRTADGKTFDNVSIGWNNYTPTSLEEQTLTGTLKLDSIKNEVQQAEPVVTTTVSVTLKELEPGSVSFADKTATYTGEPITNTIADTELPESVQSVAYTYSGNGYAASAKAPTNAGNYTVTASFTMKAGYTQLGAATAALTITKADGNVTAPTAAENLVYNGESQALIKAGASATGEVQYKLGADGAYGTAVPTATAAGTYTVYYKVVGDKNHKDVAEQSVDVSIGRKPIAVPAADATEFTYDGQEKTYGIADTPNYTVSGNKQTAANEAGYTVTVALTDKANTIWAGTESNADRTYNFIIEKKPVTAPAADETVFTYDGTEKTYNIVGTDDYTVSGNTQTAANEAGYTVTVELKDKANTIWAGTESNADRTYNFIIEKKPVTAPAADETVFTYDGTEKTYNIVETDDYTVSGNKETNANEAGYTVTVALKDASNHKWNDGTTADKTFAFKIKKAPVTITVKDKGIRTGGTLPDFTEPKLDEDFTVSGLIGEDKLTTYPTIYFEPETPDLSVVGEAPIKAKDADAGDNYIINYVDGKLTISRRPSKDKTETTVNSDGSTTKTETKSDGTVVETTTGKDGSTSTVESKTETKSDGTKVETKTETETKSDGTTVESKTEVATDKDGAKTETKTEVTTDKDGTKTEVKTEAVTAKDGTKSETTSEVKTDAEGVKSEATTTKITTADGTTGTTKTTVENGETKTEAEADVSAKAVEAAQKENKVVTVPIEVKATSDTTTATTVNINIEIKSGGQSGSADAVKIEIPVTNAGSGTVAVLVKADGTEEIIKTTLPTESGVEISVEGKATIKIVDNSKSYADTKDHWSKDEVNFVSSRELFNGVGDGNFGVSESMTRGMVNTVLARLAGENTDGGENWYAKGTEWAKQNGVSDGTNPTESVTREQLATMLYRYAGAPEVSGVIKFDDADEVSAYAQNALLWAVRNGIVNGMDETHIAPSAQAERAQVAAMMARFLRSYN